MFRPRYPEDPSATRRNQMQVTFENVESHLRMALHDMMPFKLFPGMLEQRGKLLEAANRELAAVKTEAKHMVDFIRQLQYQVQTINEGLHVAQVEKHKIVCELQKENDTSDRLRGVLEAERMVLAEVRNKAAALERQNRGLETAKDDAQAAMRDSEGRAAELEQQCSNHQAAREIAEAGLLQEQDSVKELEQQCRNHQAAREEAEAGLQQQQDCVKELEEECDRLQVDQRLAQASLVKDAERIEELEIQNAELEKTNGQIGDNASKLQSELKTQEDGVRDLQKQSDCLAKSLKSVESQLAAANEENGDLQKDCETLQNYLEKKTKRLKSEEERVRDLNGQVMDSEKILAKAVAAADAYTKDLHTKHERLFNSRLVIQASLPTGLQPIEDADSKETEAIDIPSPCASRSASESASDVSMEDGEVLDDGTQPEVRSVNDGNEHASDSLSSPLAPRAATSTALQWTGHRSDAFGCRVHVACADACIYRRASDQSTNLDDRDREERGRKRSLSVSEKFNDPSDWNKRQRQHSLPCHPLGDYY